MTRFDAVIIGAGPAGATTALALARAGWSVALIEKVPFPRKKVCGEFMSATNAALFADLGIEAAIHAETGPEIRRVAIFAGTGTITAPMPQHAGKRSGWGVAVARERLDDLLVQNAVQAGATLLMPWRATALAPDGTDFICTIMDGAETKEIRAPVAVIAHGSWERGDLPTQNMRPHRPSDLLAFKARFRDAALASDLMPLIVFPGGYGGMVNSSGKTLSLTCCIRRDMLQDVRRRHQGSAADAVLAHIGAHCRGAREVLREAVLEAPPLAAGPIAPGIRPRYAQGFFRVGNLAGEAHPIVAEGISMAMQSGWLLARLLTSRTEVGQGRDLDAIGALYAKRWRQAFAPRIHAASLFAHLAMQPVAPALLGPVLTRFPAMLTLAARLSGKTRLDAFRDG
ncbi:NAD(P)/FAD-dependent oxidoreductase [Methyloferula stellata]|uniref:NAD(P)/FAD-dependent oxidoreductase n=1 Tax=Methyloferula stellata TaxID=876270 RepID=UPI0003668ACF|nr:FAD-dependent oxidoreductase [Methyloferula stellata]